LCEKNVRKKVLGYGLKSMPSTFLMTVVIPVLRPMISKGRFLQG